MGSVATSQMLLILKKAWKMRDRLRDQLNRYLRDETVTYTSSKFGFAIGKVTTPCSKLEPDAVDAFKKAKPAGSFLGKRCGTEGCTSISHYFWGTKSDLIRNALLLGYGRGKPSLQGFQSKQAFLEARLDSVLEVVQLIESVPVDEREARAPGVLRTLNRDYVDVLRSMKLVRGVRR